VKQTHADCAGAYVDVLCAGWAGGLGGGTVRTNAMSDAPRSTCQQHAECCLECWLFLAVAVAVAAVVPLLLSLCCRRCAVFCRVVCCRSFPVAALSFPAARLPISVVALLHSHCDAFNFFARVL